MNDAATVPKRTRRHDCTAESNTVRLGMESAGDGTYITTWGCRRCPRTWTTVYDPKQAEAERLAAGRAWVAEVAARMQAEAAQERRDGVTYRRR